MKKFLKWFLFGVVLCGSIALGICYITIPEQTKAAADVVVGYLNTPLFIAGGTTITFGLVVGIVFKYVYDKYKDTIRNDLKSAKDYALAQKEQAQGYYDVVMQYKEEIKEMLGAYDSRIDHLTDCIVAICETSPNAKIKALGETIKSGATDLKKELKDNLNKVENEFEVVMEEKQTIKQLESKINELEQLVERLVNQYGEK